MLPLQLVDTRSSSAVVCSSLCTLTLLILPVMPVPVFFFFLPPPPQEYRNGVAKSGDAAVISVLDVLCFQGT